MMIYESCADTENRLSVNASKKDIDALLNRSDLTVLSRIQLLAQALVANNETKNYAKTCLRRLIKDKKIDYCFEMQRKNFLKPLLLETSFPDLVSYPLGSWVFQVPFALRKSYISRDDTDFYIFENPVKKEWVFKMPYIAPSQWKGALHAAMVQELVSCLRGGHIDEGKFTEERLRIYRFFGNEKDVASVFLNRALARHFLGGPSEGDQEDPESKREFEAKLKEVGEEFESKLREKGYRQGDVEGFQGCLHFNPTYFDTIGLEVINPHPRDTGAGKQPIYFESIPAITKDKDDKEVHTTGILNMLCVPLGGLDLSDEEAGNQAKKDFEAVAKGIKAMMTRYGFGAKTSSGFGVADVDHAVAKIEPHKFERIWHDIWNDENE